MMTSPEMITPRRPVVRRAMGDRLPPGLAPARARVAPRRWLGRLGLLLLALCVASPRVVTAQARLTIARLKYDGGGDWYANRTALPNLLKALAERTSLAIERAEAKVSLTDPELFDYPMLYVTGHGEIKLSEAEIARLREYIARGGFVHIDDNYGLDTSARRVLQQAFPDRPLVDVPLTHPIYHVVYDFPKGLPKIHEHDGAPARGYGVFVGKRLAVFFSSSSDLGNGWEDVGTYPDPPELHEQALRMGINLFVYAVTNRPRDAVTTAAAPAVARSPHGR